LSSIRFPRDWRENLDLLQAKLAEDARITALAPVLSMAKTVRYASAFGAWDVLMGQQDPDLWRVALKMAIKGPFEWSVPLSFAFLGDRVSRARRKFGPFASRLDDASILRALVALGVHRLVIQVGRS
jgi:hypothetical protein